MACPLLRHTKFIIEDRRRTMVKCKVEPREWETIIDVEQW